jgi:hypothetical protein
MRSSGPARKANAPDVWNYTQYVFDTQDTLPVIAMDDAAIDAVQALVVNAKIGKVSGRRRSQRRNGRCYRAQEGINLHALRCGQRIELGYALQHMVFSELACIVPCNQATDELFSVIGQIALPHTTPTDSRAQEA